MQKTCKQCGKTFDLSQSEIDFYTSRNLSIPKRCKECREANKRKEDVTSGEVAMADSSKPSTTQKTDVTKPSAPTAADQVKPSTAKPASGHKSIYVRILGIIAAVVLAITGSQALATDSDDFGSAESSYAVQTPALTFRNDDLLLEHYEKHGKEMGFSSAEDYEKAAAAVVYNKEALHKSEADDGDDVYYIESTNEFVIVSTDGYIRTYFKPDAGIAYYNRK